MVATLYQILQLLQNFSNLFSTFESRPSIALGMVTRNTIAWQFSNTVQNLLLLHYNFGSCWENSHIQTADAVRYSVSLRPSLTKHFQVWQRQD